MIKVFIYSCLLLVFLINCKSNIPEARNKTDYSQAVTHGEGRKRAIVKKIVESDIFLKLSLTSTVQ